MLQVLKNQDITLEEVRAICGDNIGAISPPSSYINQTIAGGTVYTLYIKGSNTPIGYCALRVVSFAGCPEYVTVIDMFGVKPIYRGKGYGKRFWETLESVYITTKKIILQSLYIRQSYEEALKLYGEMSSHHIFTIDMNRVAYNLAGSCDFWASVGFNIRKLNIVIGGILDPNLVMQKNKV